MTSGLSYSFHKHTSVSQSIFEVPSSVRCFPKKGFHGEILGKTIHCLPVENSHCAMNSFNVSPFFLDSFIHATPLKFCRICFAETLDYCLLGLQNLEFPRIGFHLLLPLSTSSVGPTWHIHVELGLDGAVARLTLWRRKCPKNNSHREFTGLGGVAGPYASPRFAD